MLVVAAKLFVTKQWVVINNNNNNSLQATCKFGLQATTGFASHKQIQCSFIVIVAKEIEKIELLFHFICAKMCFSISIIRINFYL